MTSTLLALILACTTTKSTDGDSNASSNLSDTDSVADCQNRPWEQTSTGEALSWPGQGVSQSEAEQAQLITERLLQEPGMGLIFYREEGTERYIVQTAHQQTAFSRRGGVYSWDTELEWCQDGAQLSQYNDQLSGANPNNVSLNDYRAEDERVSFFDNDSTCWPELAPRIAQIFDSPNSPDLGFALAPYARSGSNSYGTHGGIDLAQSRAPLLMRGPGLQAGRFEFSANHVDIAPTIAALLGVKPTSGVDGRSQHHADNLMLKWQDGEVLAEVLNDCPYGAANHAILFILDGLNSAELLRGIQSGDLPNIARIADAQATIIEGGSVVGWPSFSLPGHVSVYTGAYQGHHGLLSNNFLDRESQQSAVSTSLSEMLVNQSALENLMDEQLSAEVETIFEAIARSYPGAVTASINELTVRGATWGRLTQQPTAGSDPLPPPADLLQTELADASAVLQIQQLFEEVVAPKFVGISFYLTDAAGEQRGPHSDLLRQALIDTDTRIGLILDLYEAADLFDDTLFVLTADHGMGLQDPSRIYPVGEQLSGLNLSNHSQMLILQ